MAILHFIEVLENSKWSFIDAVKNVIKDVSKTVKNIKSVYVHDTQATVNENQISEYRVNAKVCFGILDNH